jgi:hypothetical protein
MRIEDSGSSMEDGARFSVYDLPTSNQGAFIG